MSTDTIPTANNGDVADQSKFNIFKTVLSGDIVPRNTSGVATTLAGGIGDGTYNWDTSYIKDIHRDLDVQTTGTVDMDTDNVYIKTSSSLTNNGGNTNYIQLDSYTFTLSSSAFINIFFSCTSVTVNAYTDFAHLMLVPSTSHIVGYLALDVFQNTSALATNIRSRPNYYLENILYCASTSGTFPDFNGSAVRLSGDFYFEAGTHTVYLVHGLDGGGTSSNNISYNNCSYGARRVV